MNKDKKSVKKSARGSVTNTNTAATKVDSGSSLAGNQRVSDPEGIYEIEEKLPGSPAGGAPLHQDLFTQGHRWTEAPGKVEPTSGKGGIG